MWETVELHEIRVFLVLAEELHFGRTAERLLISRSRVSQVIGTLESRVGGRLFDRTSRRVQLTPVGEQLLGATGPLVEQLRLAFNHAHETAIGAAGVLRIGMTPTTGVPSLSDLIEAFRARHPRSEIAYNELNIWDPYTKLRRGEIDVLINWLAVDEPDLTAGPALSHHLRVLAVGRTHPLAQQASVSLEELGEEFLGEPSRSFPLALQDVFFPPRTPSGRMIRRLPMPSTTHERIARIAHGDIVHISMANMPLFQREDIVCVPIDDLAPISLGLIWVTSTMNAKIRALADTALAMCPQTGQRQVTDDPPAWAGKRPPQHAAPVP